MLVGIRHLEDGVRVLHLADGVKGGGGLAGRGLGALIGIAAAQIGEEALDPFGGGLVFSHVLADGGRQGRPGGRDRAYERQQPLAHDDDRGVARANVHDDDRLIGDGVAAGILHGARNGQRLDINGDGGQFRGHQ